MPSCLARPHLMSVCVAVTAPVHKASWKFVCGFFLPGTDSHREHFLQGNCQCQVLNQIHYERTPKKPLSKVFLASTGEQTPIVHGPLHVAGVAAPRREHLPGAPTAPSLCRAAGLLLPRNHWSLTFFVPQFLL